MTAPRLSDKYLLLLRHGDTEGRYGGDGSRVVGAVVMHAANIGMHRELVYRLLLDPQHKGGFACLRRRRPNLERWFASVWSSAERHAAAHPVINDKADAAYRAAQYLEAAEAMSWSGRAGATDIAVLRAVVTICQRVGRVHDVAMAVRELAELARVNLATVHRSLLRLQGRGLVRLASASNGRSPSRYSLALGATPLQQSVLHRHVGHDCCARVAPSDAWRWGGGLGLSTARIFGLLTEEPVPASTLAAILGVHRRTTQRHLARLAEHGLAERTEDGWVRGLADPDHVAHELGVAGASFAQRRGHQEDRRRYREGATVVDPETGQVHHLRDLASGVPGPSRQEGVA